MTCRLTAALLMAATLSAEIIKPERRVDWTYCGIPGGIPNRTTIFTTLTSANTLADINTAIDNCPSNQVVLLTDGVYTLNGTINFDGFANSGVTLRGQGTNTILHFTHSADPCFNTSQFYEFTNPQAISSGYTKGSTSIVLGSAPHANVTVGNLIQIDALDVEDLMYSGDGPGRLLKLKARVTGVSGNTVTFEPPLAWTFLAGDSPEMRSLSGGPPITGIGIENMRIVNDASSTVIQYWGADRSWVYNCELTNVLSQGIQTLGATFQVELRKNFIHHAADYDNQDDGYAINIYGGDWLLIVDNILSRVASGVMNEALNNASCNAIVYNFIREIGFQSFGNQTAGINMNHGHHTIMTLAEGNVTHQIQTDSFHGSSSHGTIFRNWVHGIDDNGYTGNRKMLSIERGSQSYNVVGNILGSPLWSGPGTFKYEMTGEPGYSEQAVIYRLGYPNVANNDVTETGDNMWLDNYPNINYPDDLTTNSVARHGNYDYFNDAQVWETDNDNVTDFTDQSIPNSMLYSSKPSWFYGLAWPAYVPSAPGNASADDIPAGYRYLNSMQDPPAEGSSGVGATFGSGVRAVGSGVIIQ